MRKAHLAAIAALDKIASFQRVVGTTPISAAFGNFTFWEGGHVYLLIAYLRISLPDLTKFHIHKNTCPQAGRAIIRMKGGDVKSEIAHFPFPTLARR